MSKFTVRVRLDGKISDFVCIAHHSRSTGELIMDPVEFYGKNAPGGKVPSGSHYEMEFISPPAWNHAHAKAIHTFRINANMHMVCWTGQLKTIKQAMSLFRVWSVGTVFTMKTGQGFEKHYTGDTDAFFKSMRTVYGIEIVGSEIQKCRARL